MDAGEEHCRRRRRLVIQPCTSTTCRACAELLPDMEYGIRMTPARRTGKRKKRMGRGLPAFLVSLTGLVLIFHSGHAYSQTELPMLLLTTAKQSPQLAAVPGFPLLYQSSVSKSCNSTSQCVLAFARVKDNHLLQATNINCLAVPTVTNPNVVEQVAITLFTGNLSDPQTVEVFDQFIPPSDPEQPFRFGVNETILSFFRADSRPKAIVGTGGFDANISFTCKLTGTLLKP